MRTRVAGLKESVVCKSAGVKIIGTRVKDRAQERGKEVRGVPEAESAVCRSWSRSFSPINCKGVFEHGLAIRPRRFTPGIFVRRSTVETSPLLSSLSTPDR